MNRIEKRHPLERLLSWSSRVLVWALIVGAIYLLRSFFLLIFLTFVFAYIQARAVSRLEKVLTNRTLRVVIVALVFLGVLTAVGSFLVPSITGQAKIFANNYTTYLRSFDEHSLNLVSRYPMIRDFVPIELPTVVDPAADTLSPDTSISMQILQLFFGTGDRPAGKEDLRLMVEKIRNIGGYLVASVSAFLLSLLFSFLIVLDMPRLTSTIKDLQNTKLGFIYNEVSEGIVAFASVMGRALEAQFFIAVFNTLLTALGLWLLGLESKVAFLSLIVFLCSFIPIAGVFISSVPICLVALQASGLPLALLAIVLITIIHLIEAYILNPRIYGHHLRMNPVLVLIVLTLAGKLAGIWGLVLALPAGRYFFGQAIRYDQR